MRRRTGALGTLTALASAVALAHPAHAQDLDCRDFTYQEEAQAAFDRDRSDPHRLDEDPGPDDGKACEALPARAAGLTSSTTSPRPTATTAGPTTATATPTRTATATTTATPTRTVTATVPTGAASTTAAPPASARTASGDAATPTSAGSSPATRGVRGGVGGASADGPSGWDIAAGAVFVAGAGVAAGYWLRRRRS